MATYGYDPSIDIQLGAIWRGLLDTVGDTATARSRLAADYATGLAQLEQASGRSSTQLGWSQEDLTRNYQRALEDLNRNRTRTGEDYQRAIQQLQRSYQRLAQQQAQQRGAMGVLRGGAVLAAARRRAENQAWDRQPIDTGYQRAMQDYQTSESRLGQDYQTSLSRLAAQREWLGQDQATGVSQLGLQFDRGWEDLGTRETRAAREAMQAFIDYSPFSRYRGLI